MSNDGVKLKGIVRVRLYDKDGNLKDESVHENIVVNGGKDFIFDQISGTATTTNMQYMAIGTGTTAAAATDTALETEVGTRQAITYSHTAGTNSMTATATFGAGNGTGTINEMGLFTASSGGTMLNRVTGLSKTKGSSDSLEITYTLTLS